MIHQEEVNEHHLHHEAMKKEIKKHTKVFSNSNSNSKKQVVETSGPGFSQVEITEYVQNPSVKGVRASEDTELLNDIAQLLTPNPIHVFSKNARRKNLKHQENERVVPVAKVFPGNFISKSRDGQLLQ